MYGQHWLNLWAGIPIDDVRQTWMEDLARFDLRTIAKALEHTKEHNKFPPTCSEFVMLCRSFRLMPDTRPALPDYSTHPTPESSAIARSVLDRFRNKTTT